MPVPMTVLVTVLTALVAALMPMTPAFAAAPANDGFENAETIVGPAGRLPVSFGAATTEPDEPAANRGYPSVWFRWTAPADGWYEFWLEGVDPEWCEGTTPVYLGEDLESLDLRSHEGATDIWGGSGNAWVKVKAGQSYAVAAASTCGNADNLTFNWEADAPLIVSVLRPDGTKGAGDAVSVEVDWMDWGARANAAGRVYFPATPGTNEINVYPRSLNLLRATRRVVVTGDPVTPVHVPVRLRAATLDLDRDGKGDVVSGVPRADRGTVNAGVVVVRYGDGSTQVIHENTTGVPSAQMRRELFGASVAAGDVDRDGWTDLTIGAPGEIVNGIRSGAIFVVFGSDRGLARGKRTMRLHQGSPDVPGSPAAGDAFGAVVLPGIRWSMTHFFVGMPGKNVGGVTDAGAVVRFTRFLRDPKQRHATPQLFHQNTPGVGGVNAAGDRFGSALAHGAFDQHHAGNLESPWPSLAIGVPGKDAAGARDAGAIVVLRGLRRAGGFAASGNPLINQNSPVIPGAVIPGAGARAGNRFGAALASVSGALPMSGRCGCTGELDYEGFPPDFLAVGAPGEGGGAAYMLRPGAGAPHVFASAPDNLRLAQGTNGVPGGNEHGDGFGSTLAMGDVDDDQTVDLVVGAPGEALSGASAAGAVTVLYGRLIGTQDNCCTWRVADGVTHARGRSGVPGSPTAGDRFGQSAAVVDVNGDGWPDVAAGAPGDDTTVNNGGAIYTVTGASTGLSGGRRQVWTGARSNDGFGSRIAGRQLMYSDR